MTTAENQTTIPDSVRQAIAALLTKARAEQYTGTAVLRLNFNQGGVTAVRPLKETVFTNK